MNLGTEGALDDVKIHPEVEGGGGGEMQWMEADPTSVLFVGAIKDCL